MTALASWYKAHGRHDLAWRNTTDRWAVLVSEVMLAQTQVARIEVAWPPFMQQFPTACSMSQATPGDVIAAWGRLGYPRRARRLWEAARVIAEHGWPHADTSLPGVGPYTAGALRAQVDDDANAIGIDVNLRRVAQRVAGRRLCDIEAGDICTQIAAPLEGRTRFLALMDLGALQCTPRNPACDGCPLHAVCTTRGPLADEVRKRQAPYKGSLRQHRGDILAKLRDTTTINAAAFDDSSQTREALQSLVDDQLVEISNGNVSLARA